MVIILGFLVWLILYYRTKKIRGEEKKKFVISKQIAEIEMKALQSQMNPHFVFNSINSIQGFILKNKVDDALGYLQDFAKILRQTLDNATKKYISLEEEIEYIKWYLNLELMRFDQKFKVELRVPDNLNPQNIQIPPMIVQPYVENAIRHGLLHRNDGQGILLIEFLVLGEQDLKCIIEDNGVGRKRCKEIESWKTQTTHKPQSTRITKDRIDLLNKSSQSDKYEVNIIDLCDGHGVGTGTRVEIILPLMTL
jgi:LytS/YehU family sensor histidine kinase